jgi:hypothetical protein
MIEKYYLTIFSSNDNQKIVENQFECKDMIEVSRLMLGFIPKRGYAAFQYQVDKWVGLDVYV